MKTFKDGIVVNQITWRDNSIMQKGKPGIVNMEISMEPGQGAMVPFVKITWKDGDVGMVAVSNLDLVVLESTE